VAGFDLKEGQYDERNASDDELWSAFACVFSSKSRNDSSYKFGFLKSIIDNLYNVDNDLTLSFDQLFSKFGEIYWNLILKHGLRQKVVTNDNRETYLEQVLYATVDKYRIYEPIPYESLTQEMMVDISHQVKVKCKKYVVGALFEDTNHLFYSFSRKEEWIKINPVMYEFICKHKVVIEKLNYYEWARFLERINEESVVVRLLDKIDESAKRNNLSAYRQILYDEFEYKNCFYCGKPLRSDKIDVDHFIPWSFIKDDNLWNLVLACPSCNRRKSDKLPAGKYLTDLIDRNHHIIIETHRSDMQNYQDRMVSYVYNWAKINGYDKIWQPDGKKVNS
jgi:5-methylcytosine-specific restriction endonuclease McrA